MLDGVQGWLTDAQADRLRAAAARVPAGAADRRDRLLPRAVDDRAGARRRTAAEVVAIDPHAGNDRGPGEWTGTSAEGECRQRARSRPTSRAAGVAERVRHVRRPSQDALDAVAGAVDVLYVDGAHRYAPARGRHQRAGARAWRPAGRC